MHFDYWDCHKTHIRYIFFLKKEPSLFDSKHMANIVFKNNLKKKKGRLWWQYWIRGWPNGYIGHNRKIAYLQNIVQVGIECNTIFRWSRLVHKTKKQNRNRMRMKYFNVILLKYSNLQKNKVFIINTFEEDNLNNLVKKYIFSFSSF